MEQWKDIIGWEGYYQVSDLGNIKSLKRKGVTNYGERDYAGSCVNPIKCKSGYIAVNLTKQGFRQQKHIHVAVLEAFIGERPYKYDACHNNGIRSDCRLENLRWDTRKNNHADKKKHGTTQRNVKKITKEIADKIKQLTIPISDIATMYGISNTQIWRIKTDRSWV